MKRKEVAQDTLRVLEQGYFINPNGERIDIAEAQKKAEEALYAIPLPCLKRFWPMILKTKQKAHNFK